jgi:hypothetical protein
MSGWDASSRPSWDPQSGPGENTQSFGIPDYPEDGGGFPSSPTPGTPPAIFLQDYDQNEIVQDDFGRTDFGRDHGRNGFAHSEPAQGDFARNGAGRDDLAWDDFGQQDGAGRGYGRDEDFGRGSQGQRGPAQQDYPRQDYQWDGSQRQGPQWDDGQRQAPGRGQASGDYPADFQDPRGPADPDYAARLDPALRDFFAAQPDNQEYAQPGFGQQRPAPRAYQGQGPARGPVAPGGAPNGQGGQFGPGTANGYRQPGGQPAGFRQPQRSDWDSAAPRPGSRSARHVEARNAGRKGNGGRPTASIVITVVVVLIMAAVGGYLLLRGKPAKPPARNVPASSTPSSSAPAAKSTGASKGGGSTAKAAYILKTPATAGGYAKLASVPTAVKTAAGTTAAAIKGAATKDGGKVAGQVTAVYAMSAGQVLAFTGFTGTFNPTKVMASLASLGTAAHPATAGPHGGMLDCATAPGTPAGTICVWVTTTTMGVTEFFSSTGPEVVTQQSKAATDALKFRDDVEVPKTRA